MSEPIPNESCPVCAWLPDRQVPKGISGDSIDSMRYGFIEKGRRLAAHAIRAQASAMRLAAAVMTTPSPIRGLFTGREEEWVAAAMEEIAAALEKPRPERAPKDVSNR